MIFWKFTSWFFTIMIMLRLVASSAATHPTPNMQKTALFQFKQSLSIGNLTYYICGYLYQIPPHPKTVNWNMSSDHCTWEGVTCEHKTGDVIGLDLSCSVLVGAIHSNSTLFQLFHLQSLNLFGNDFSLSNQFPEEFGFFAKGLTHLNLSNTGFSGFSGVSHLYKLVSLDLSSQDIGYIQLEYGEFKLLLQNLTQLRVLNLNRVQINSVLPINFSTSLRVLNLGSTGLYGVVPQEIFHLPNLEVLDLSVDTADLVLTLPKVKWGSSGSLQHLDLFGMKIYGGIPDSIGFLESLATLSLFDCNLFGPIPRSIGNLSRLSELDLSYNHLNGPIPRSIGNLSRLSELDLGHNHLNDPIPRSIGNLSRLSELDLSENHLKGPIPKFEANHTNLRFLDLGHNNLTGPFPSWVAHHFELNLIDLSSNSLTGPLPSWLFELPLLTDLIIDNNRFTAHLYEFNSSKSLLRALYFGNNLLVGPIPQSFSQLVNLDHLDISSNNFSGVLDIQMFSRFNYLESLYLSHNSLSVRSSSMATLPPNLDYLGLSSCQMKEFPHIAGDAKNLESLDLSNNQIDGEIPHWAGSIVSLNLSHNRLTGGLEKLRWNNINVLDLQSNMLSGSLPSLFCNSSSLEILNLSHNNLSGVLPICRTNLTSLSVFDVQMNNIQGNLPSTLSNFRNLVSLNLHGNKLQGRIPSSFDEFDNLEVLNLGSNQMNDTFPHFLEALPNLQVLVLRSNKFHGLINKSSKIEHPFPSLRILDLSYNEFSGPLPTIYFKNFKAMMDGDVNKKKATYMTHFLTHGEASYSDSTSLVIKGMEIELVRILTVFTTIDVSTNNFEGEIGEYIGNLVSLIYLNLSHNHLTGHIPSSIGKLSMLESLDLSYNRLGGEIPPQLANISFLARLNLSQNQLSGQIPKGPQFNTFDNDSYVGNLGLCGYPLSKECERDTGIQEEEDEDDDYFFSGFTWKAVVIGYGCGVVPAFTIGYLMLLAGKPKWFAGIIAGELGLKVRRMEIRMRYI